MASINKIILLGRIGRVETRVFSSGDTIVEASLATGEKYKDRNGEVKEDTQWHNLVFRGKLAPIAEKFLHKGDLVYVDGRMTYRKYTSSKDNAEKTLAEVSVTNVQFLSSKTDNGQAPKHAQAESAAIDDENEDIPF